MRKSIGLAAIAVALTFISSHGAEASVIKAGANCTQLSKVVKSAGKDLQCKLVNKKLVWVSKPVTKTSTANPASSATPSPTASTPAAPTSKSPVAQTLTSTFPPKISLLGSDFGAGFMTSSGLPLTIASNTPTVCSADASGIHLLTTGICKLTASQTGNSAYLPATLDASFEVTPPVLTVADDQFTNAKQFNLVPKGQTYKAELFEFTLLQVTDNVDATLCADSAENQGCIVDSYGDVKVNPNEPNRAIKVHVKVKDTSTELLGPTYYFRLLLSGKIYDVNLNATLPNLNDATIQPGDTAEGDYYLTLPKGLALDHAYLVFDDSFVSADQVVIFAL